MPDIEKDLLTEKEIHVLADRFEKVFDMLPSESVKLPEKRQEIACLIGREIIRASRVSIRSQLPEPLAEFFQTQMYRIVTVDNITSGVNSLDNFEANIGKSFFEWSVDKLRTSLSRSDGRLYGKYTEGKEIELRDLIFEISRALALSSEHGDLAGSISLLIRDYGVEKFCEWKSISRA